LLIWLPDCDDIKPKAHQTTGHRLIKAFRWNIFERSR